MWIESRALLEPCDDGAQQTRDELRRRQIVALEVSFTELAKSARLGGYEVYKISDRIGPCDTWAYFLLDWGRNYAIKHKKSDGPCFEMLIPSAAGPSADEIAVFDVVWPGMEGLGSPLSDAECKCIGVNRGYKYPSNTCLAMYSREKFGLCNPGLDEGLPAGQASLPMRRLDKALPEVQCWKTHEAVEEMYKKGYDPQDRFGGPLPAASFISPFRGASVADKQAAHRVQLGRSIGSALRRRAAATLGAAIHDPDTSDTALPDIEGFPAVTTNDVDESIGTVFQRPRTALTVTQLDRAATVLSLSDLSRRAVGVFSGSNTATDQPLLALAAKDEDLWATFGILAL
ncbi:unnamed protein product, partial [Prorocentrum cordatum]